MVEQSYQFLYWTEGKELDDDPKEKTIKCQKVKTACRRFMKWKGDMVTRVDYEVRDASGRFIDISDEPGFTDLI